MSKSRILLAVIFLTIVISYSQFVNACVSEGLNVGLVANYKLNGNANDETMQNNGVTEGVIPTQDRICAENGAYNFNGANSYIEKANPTSSLNLGSNSWSISAWINTNSTVGAIAIVSRYECGWNNCVSNGPTNAAAMYDLDINDGSVVMWVRGDNAVQYGVNTSGKLLIANGKWYHVVGILDRASSELRIYVNGEKINTASAAGLATVTDEGSPLEIGRAFITGWGVPGGYFNGKIDDVRIYNRAISDCEVAELYYKD